MSQISFVWGVKRSFLRYLSNLPGTQASVEGGAASTTDSQFVFPSAEGIHDARTGSGTLKFEGRVRFTSHGGMLDLVLADPWVEIDRSTALLSFVTNQSEAPGVLRIAICELLEQPADRRDGARAWDTRLSRAGVPVFGDTYAAGEPLDPAFVLTSPLTSSTPNS